MPRHIFKHYIRRVSSIGNSFEVLEQDVGRICGIFHMDAIVLHRKPHAIKRHIEPGSYSLRETSRHSLKLTLDTQPMHQPQKRQTTRTPATQIQVSSQNLQRVFRHTFRSSWEISDIPYRPTVCIMSVYSTPSSKERHMARNAHPEVTRQRILDAAKKAVRAKGV